MRTIIKNMPRNLEDLMAERFYNTIHSKRIKIGIIKSKLRRISEYYANGKMSKEDFDRTKNELQLKLENI